MGHTLLRGRDFYIISRISGVQSFFKLELCNVTRFCTSSLLTQGETTYHLSIKLLLRSGQVSLIHIEQFLHFVKVAGSANLATHIHKIC